MKATLEGIFAGVAALLICTGASSAADLHPIVEVQSGYLFGAISDGKWIKADETAKLIGDETTYRVWQLYLHGSAYAFAVGLLNIYQVLLLKPDSGRSGLPLTRKDWYR